MLPDAMMSSSGDEGAMISLRTPLLLLAVLVVPLVIADAPTWGDPAGDVVVTMPMGTDARGLVSCSDDRVDITSLAASATDSFVRFTFSVVDPAATPSCGVQGAPERVPLRGAPWFELALGDTTTYAHDYVLLTMRFFSEGHECYGEVQLAGHYSQVTECDVEREGGTTGMRIATHLPDYDGPVGSTFDVRDFPWPAGSAMGVSAAGVGGNFGAGMSFRDSMDLSDFQLS